MAEADNQAKDIIAAARRAAEEAGRVIEEKSRKEAQLLVENAERDIGKARDKAVATLRKESADLSIALAGKLIGANLDDEKNRSMVDKLIDRYSHVADTHNPAIREGRFQLGQGNRPGGERPHAISSACATCVRQSPDLSAFLTNYMVPAEQRLDVLKSLFEGRLTDADVPVPDVSRGATAAADAGVHHRFFQRAL